MEFGFAISLGLFLVFWVIFRLAGRGGRSIRRGRSRDGGSFEDIGSWWSDGGDGGGNGGGSDGGGGS